MTDQLRRNGIDSNTAIQDSKWHHSKHIVVNNLIQYEDRMLQQHNGVSVHCIAHKTIGDNKADLK